MRYALFLIISILFSGCAVQRDIVSRGDRKIARSLERSAVFSGHDLGFVLYDPEKDDVVFERASHRYFTPGSNTKIFTLLAAKKMLPDSVIAFGYRISGDTLLLAGMADPSFLYKGDSVSFRRLQALVEVHDGPVMVVPGTPVSRYGAGWAWDDYPYSFQAERSVFPVFGNRLTAAREGDGLRLLPHHFAEYVIESSSLPSPIAREPEANVFQVNPELMEEGVAYTIPFITSDYDLSQILGDLLGANVGVAYDRPASGEQYTFVTGPPTDTLLKVLMHKSDNFIAEQLMLQAALLKVGEADVTQAIAYALKHYFADSPEAPAWVDGSGLSRYNLFTPSSVVHALGLLYDAQGPDYIAKILPAIPLDRSTAGSPGDPFGPEIYAKTGSLRNNYCLSGFITCRSGRLLIFSFMNNRFTGSQAEIQRAMHAVFLDIYEAY